VAVSDAILLMVHAGSIDQNSVLVDDINDGRDLSDMDKLLERHFRSTNNS
jgi:hypothetical protein